MDGQGRGPLASSGTRVIVSGPVHSQLRVLKEELTAVRGREVTYTEIIEELLDGRSQLCQDIAGGRR